MSKRTDLSDRNFDSIELVDRPWFPYLCTEVEHWQWRTQGEAHYTLWMALAGTGYLSCAGRTYQIRPGSFFVFSPGQAITAMHTSGPRVTRFSAHFQPVRGGRRLKGVSGLPLLGGQAEPLTQVQGRIDALMRLAISREAGDQLSRGLYELLRDLMAGDPGTGAAGLSPAVGEAIRLFREQAAGVDSIEALARRLGVSRSHFDREFTRQVGQAPRQFLIQCKMIEARRYLESSQLRVGEIAEALGYRDIYFFSRQFKQQVGLSPLNYRRSLRNKEAN